ncbi:MAG TPA: hypothetical protein VGO11_16005 [Chthoniobacteraceae bacterium]|jgi:hypothetical protein|nr:hypothetical protein [Chthoniobacteraceae bacterium]
MGSLDYHRTVVAYHGCDRATLRAVLDGRPLENSERSYDWLGRGVYFWEHGPRRAFEWAQEKARRGDGVVKNPAVLGAYIHLGQCFDLLDTENTALLREAYPKFVAFRENNGLAVPQNREVRGHESGERTLRYLDCAMINWFVDDMAPLGNAIQTVRGAFTEGGPCFPGSELMSKTHIQLAVRDHSCIIGYFRPQSLTIGADD